jgi:hypothetical protein
MIDCACEGIGDPADALSVSFRISRRLGWTHRDIARFVVGSGLDLVDAPAALAPRALRDIKAERATGCFTVRAAEVALAAVTGGMLGLLRQTERRPTDINRTVGGQLTEGMLHMLGVAATEAVR